MAGKTRTLAEKLERRTDKSGGPEACWPCRGQKNLKGYARIGDQGRLVGAHRVAWKLANGREIPDGMFVLHRCDNPPCVNPNHLFLGTNQENMDDMARKGREARGMRRGPAGLTEDAVRIIRASVGESDRSLARRYDVDPKTIKKARARITWAFVPEVA